MSQDTERLYCCCGAEGSVCADPDGRLPLSHVDYIADCARQPEFRMLAREVQGSRKLEVLCADHGGIEKVVAMGLAVAEWTLASDRSLGTMSRDELWEDVGERNAITELRKATIPPTKEAST